MRILLATNGSHCSHAAVQALIRQFRTENAEVHVLHAIEWPGLFPENFSFGAGPEFASEVKDFLDRERHWANELVESTARILREAGFHTTTVVVECDARKAILDYAAEWDPDLILLGSHDRRGIDRIIMGSVSEAVARHAPCSVQIIRTPGLEASSAAA